MPATYRFGCSIGGSRIWYNGSVVGLGRTARVADKCRYLFYFEYSLLFLVETYCVGRCFCDIDRLCVKGSCGWSRYRDMDFAVDYLDDVSVGSVFVVCQKAGRRTHL